MEATPEDGGSYRFRLGVVEKWIVGLGATAIVSVVGWFGFTVVTTRDAVQGMATKEAVQAISTQQAVTNARLDTLTLQLADVPSLRTQVTELKIRDEQQEKAIDELRNMRGLK